MLGERQSLQEQRDCLQAVHGYIRQHLDEPLNRAVLSNIAGFSVPHLHRLFTTATGESMGSAIRRMRMERAGRKLRMGAVDITEVALAAGYASHAAFGKAFKKHFGLSPSAFRELGCMAATQLLRKGKFPCESNSQASR